MPFSQIKGLQLAWQTTVLPQLPALPVLPVVAAIAILALTTAYHNQFKVGIIGGAVLCPVSNCYTARLVLLL